MKLLTSVSVIMCLAFLMAGKSLSVNYGIGDTVSDFKLKNVNGKMVSLSDYKDSKGVIVIFDCNTCPYSRAYNERIIALNKKYVSEGFPVVTINSNVDLSEGEMFDEMVDLAKRKNYDFPYLADNTQSVAKSFGATNTPHVFVLRNENSAFSVAYIGAIDDNSRDGASAKRKYVEEAVDALLANKPVPTAKTKALGCGIRWKE